MLHKLTENPHYSPILLNRLSRTKAIPSVLKAGKHNYEPQKPGPKSKKQGPRASHEV